MWMFIGHTEHCAFKAGTHSVIYYSVSPAEGICCEGLCVSELMAWAVSIKYLSMRLCRT